MSKDSSSPIRNPFLTQASPNRLFEGHKTSGFKAGSLLNAH
jgi:hypothetical protein